MYFFFFLIHSNDSVSLIKSISVVAGVRVSCELGCLCGWCWLYHNRCVWGLPFIWLQLCLQVLWRDVEFLLFAFGRLRFTLPTATITAAAQTAAAVAACDEPTEHKQGLCPPAGQHEVCVHIFFTKLLCYIEPQRPILIVNVPLCGIGQYCVGIIDLFKFFCCLWIIRVFIRMIFQCQFPVRLFDIIWSGIFVQPQHVI